MDSVSTNNVFEALIGEAERRVGDDVDRVVRFEGTLSEAIVANFAQGGTGSSIVFMTLSDASPDTQSAYGTPIREGLLVDISVVVRLGGRGKYQADINRLCDVSDTIVHDLFENTLRSADARKAYHGTQYVGRYRQPIGEGFISHLIRYVITPARQVTT